MSDLERNKRNAKAFYDLMFNQSKPREAIERYAGATYIQHNPHVADGKEAFIAYFEKMAKEFPGKRVSIKRRLRRGQLRHPALPPGMARLQGQGLGRHRHLPLRRRRQDRRALGRAAGRAGDFGERQYDVLAYEAGRWP